MCGSGRQSKRVSCVAFLLSLSLDINLAVQSLVSGASCRERERKTVLCSCWIEYVAIPPAGWPSIPPLADA